MPETKEITVYTFDELSDRAKERALGHWMQNCEPDLSWEIEDLQTEGSKRGFEIDDVRFDLSHSQGAGASWHGSISLSQFLDYHLREDNRDHARYVVLRELIRDGWVNDAVSVYYKGFRSVHSGAIGFNEIEYGVITGLLEDGASEAQGVGKTLHHPESILCGADVIELAKGIDCYGLIISLQDWIECEAVAYADYIYKTLRDQHDWETGEENFRELCEINEWRFDAAGNLV